MTRTTGRQVSRSRVGELHHGRITRWVSVTDGVEWDGRVVRSVDTGARIRSPDTPVIAPTDGPWSGSRRLERFPSGSVRTLVDWSLHDRRPVRGVHRIAIRGGTSTDRHSSSRESTGIRDLTDGTLRHASSSSRLATCGGRAVGRTPKTTLHPAVTRDSLPNSRYRRSPLSPAHECRTTATEVVSRSKNERVEYDQI